MQQASAETRILAAIRAIPHGQVAGYGHVARRAGLPGRARLVARVLANNEDAALPWHRVLRSDGRIAFPEGSRGWREQSQRLRAEGVRVERGRVRMPAEDASLDAMIWGGILLDAGDEDAAPSGTAASAQAGRRAAGKAKAKTPPKKTSGRRAGG